MKETITEYARILIVFISFAMLISFLFSGIWFNQIGKASLSMENKVITEKQDTAFDKLSNRSNPEIYVEGKTVHVGEIVNLFSLIPDNYNGSYAVQDADNKNLKNLVKISCDSEDYNIDDRTLIPSRAGVYEVVYTVTDSYGLSTSKTITIVAK